MVNEQNAFVLIKPLISVSALKMYTLFTVPAIFEPALRLIG